jgi:hypothetical protein
MTDEDAAAAIAAAFGEEGSAAARAAPSAAALPDESPQSPRAASLRASRLFDLLGLQMSDDAEVENFAAIGRSDRDRDRERERERAAGSAPVSARRAPLDAFGVRRFAAERLELC